MKAIKNISTIAAIIILSVLIGIFAEQIKGAYDRASYPREYSEFVEKYSVEYRVPETVIYAVIKCESGFDSAAVSKAGAIGLMQLMPDTFDYLCKKLGQSYETGMLYDPETNIKYGTYYLSMLYERFGIWKNAFAAYNGGPNRVEGWIAEGKVNESGSLIDIPISQTAAYVEKVAAAAQKYDELYYVNINGQEK